MLILRSWLNVFDNINIRHVLTVVPQNICDFKCTWRTAIYVEIHTLTQRHVTRTTTFHCYVDVRCVCCGAECDMLAAQCNILVGHWTSRLSELTFRWYAAVQNMWAQNSCTCFLSLFQARQWWRIMWTLRTRLQRPHFVALHSSC